MAVSPSTPRRDLFGDVAVSKGLLTWAQVRDALKKQMQHRGQGIPIRIGELCVEMGLLTAAQCNQVLTEQTARRKTTATAEKKPASPNLSEEPDAGESYQLGRFRLEKRLGGVMGVVYRGVDTQSGQTIALKVLPKTLAYETAFVERFKREVKATSALAHPNIVRIHDAGVEQGVFYLAMEYIEGESLNELLRRQGRLLEPEALKLGREVARALAHAHAHSILHRDVKPENVMVTKAGQVKLTDFGLAKLLADHQQITAEGIAVGTPHYIAPEQARALKETDHRADLYALGATIFHMVTGRLPYEGDDGAEIMRRHVFDKVPDARAVNPSVSAETAAVIAKLMAKDPGERYQTAADLVKALDAILGPDATAPAAPPPPAQPPQSPPIHPPMAMPRKRFGTE